MQFGSGVCVPRMKRLFLLFGLLAACEAPQAEQTAEPVAAPVVVNVPEIAGKSEAEVARILGEPTERSTTKNDGKTYPDLYYRGGQVEVVYVDGRAEWISVMNLTHLPFSEDALSALGITGAGAPSFACRGVIRWENHKRPPLHGIHLFPRDGGQLDHAYIQVTRRP